MNEKFSRTALMFGEEAIERLKNSRVAVFGIGGVGGHASEALARSGIGTLDLIDNDEVSVSNINRQLYALDSTVGMAKVDAAKARIADINPDCKVNVYKCFFMPDTADNFDFSQYDYVIDAIDTVAGKLALIEACKSVGTPIICAMGAGNKIDPTMFTVTDISKTIGDPLARVIRAECRKRDLKGIKVVYSTETPVCHAKETGRKAQTLEKTSGRRSIPGSTSFVPPVVGLLMASEVIKDLLKNKGVL